MRWRFKRSRKEREPGSRRSIATAARSGAMKARLQINTARNSLYEILAGSSDWSPKALARCLTVNWVNSASISGASPTDPKARSSESTITPSWLVSICWNSYLKGINTSVGRVYATSWRTIFNNKFKEAKTRRLLKTSVGESNATPAGGREQCVAMNGCWRASSVVMLREN